MANALNNMTGTNFPLAYYKALAWGGLEGTRYYNNTISPTQKQEPDSKTNILLLNRSKNACDD